MMYSDCHRALHEYGCQHLNAAQKLVVSDQFSAHFWACPYPRDGLTVSFNIKLSRISESAQIVLLIWVAHMQELSNRHYLVTGGCGFIGGHLVRALIARGHRVRVLDDLSTGSVSVLPANAEPRSSAATMTGSDRIAPMLAARLRLWRRRAPPLLSLCRLYGPHPPRSMAQQRLCQSGRRPRPRRFRPMGPTSSPVSCTAKRLRTPLGSRIPQCAFSTCTGRGKTRIRPIPA